MKPDEPPSDNLPVDRELYQRILRQLEKLEGEESATCDPSWSEFLQEKWKDLLLIGLLVIIVLLIVVWAVRRKSSM